jgi:hypothetical protein
MPTVIPDLWGDSVSPDIITPTMILNAQAEQLSRKSKGYIRAELDKEPTEHFTTLAFDVIAPGARYLRRRLFQIRFENDLVYPATVSTDFYFDYLAGGKRGAVQTNFDESTSCEAVAYTQDDFIQIIKSVLQSQHVMSTIQSLIALSNEANARLSNGTAPVTDETSS